MGGGSKQQTTWYSGIQVQTTDPSTPIAIVWGSNRITATCITYTDFIVKQKPAKAGGKGGALSSVSGKTENVYYATIVLGLCEGPIAGVARCWPTSGQPTDLATVGSGLVCLDGTDPQAPWSYMVGAHPSMALGYNGIANLIAYEYDLGPSASLGSTAFEVLGIFGRLNSVPINDEGEVAFEGEDADPALIVQDFLTNSQYGVGFPAASIDLSSLIESGTGTSYQAYCGALGLKMSPALTSQEKASDILARWLKLTNTTCVWSSGVLRFIPFGDSALSGNGFSWTPPNAAVLYSLTDEDFADPGRDQDPVEITRIDPYSIDNWISLEIMSRGDEYNTGPIAAWDQAMIDRFGLRVGGAITAHEICDVAVAQLAAQLILQRDTYVRRTFQFKLSWEFGLLDPMDLVAVTDPLLGLVGEVVRIIDIEEDGDGLLAVTAEEYPQGAATAVAYPVPVNQGPGVPDTGVPAVAISTPIIFEPPSALTGGMAQIWCAVAPAEGDPDWGGCVVWASFDGTSFVEVGTIGGASTMGATIAALAIYGGSNPDTADTLSVNMTTSGLPLNSTTAANASNGATTAYVGGEYIAFETATLTSANNYDLTILWRGLDTVSSANIPANSPFALLSGQIFKYTIPASLVGTTIYLKFQSFNIFGGGLQDLSLCVVYSYGASGEGLPYGPVTEALLWGENLDYGHEAGDPVTISDDFGASVTALATVSVDLGYGL